MGPILQGSRCGLEWNLALDCKMGPVLPGGPTPASGWLLEACAVPHIQSVRLVARRSSASRPSTTWHAVEVPGHPRLYALRSGLGTFLGCDQGGRPVQVRTWLSKAVFTVLPTGSFQH